MFANSANSSCAMACLIRSARTIPPNTEATLGSNEVDRRVVDCALVEDKER